LVAEIAKRMVVLMLCRSLLFVAVAAVVQGEKIPKRTIGS
jgi:hypothetical protein